MSHYVPVVSPFPIARLPGMAEPSVSADDLRSTWASWNWLVLWNMAFHIINSG